LIDVRVDRLPEIIFINKLRTNNKDWRYFRNPQGREVLQCSWTKLHTSA